jgi:Xaa-Pro aminopeptidase
MFKSAAEIALMQRANDITIEAFRAAFATLTEGMTHVELQRNIQAAFAALGAPGGGASAQFGKYTEFPHGSITPQRLQPGDVVLVDGGCNIGGYQSDVTRTVVFGKPTQRQIDVWNLEKRAQAAAFTAAQVGATCESVDAAARKVITDAGFGPDYKVPGLPHRTGHGIGMDARMDQLRPWQQDPPRAGHVLQRRADDRHLRRVRHSPRGLSIHHRAGTTILYPAVAVNRSPVRLGSPFTTAVAHG